MTRRLRSVLLAGCGLVLALEAPVTFTVVGEDWRGPYPEVEPSAASLAGPIGALDLVIAMALLAHLPG